MAEFVAVDPMPAIEVTFRPDISGARCEPITVEIDADVVWESMPSQLTAAELRQACEDSQPLVDQLAMHIREDLPVWMDLDVCEWEWVRLAVDVANPCYGQAEALPGIAPPPESVRITWPEVAA